MMNNQPLSDNFVNNEQIYDLFVTKAASEASEIVERHAGRVRTRISILLAIAIALLGGIVTLALESFRESIVDDAKLATSSTFNRKISEFLTSDDFKSASSAIHSSDIDEIRLNFTALVDQLNKINQMQRFAENESFSGDEAEDLVSFLEGYAKSDRKFISVSEHRARVIIDFARADRRDLIYRLEKAYIDEIRQSPSIVNAMVQSLGLDLASSPIDLSIVKDGRLFDEWADLANNYERYARYAHELNYPEATYIYDIILAHKKGLAPGYIENLISSGRNLSAGEMNSAFQLGKAILTGEWTRSSDDSADLARGTLVEILQRYGANETVGIISALREETLN